MQWASFLGCPPSWAQILLMPDHHLQVGHLQLRALANAQLAHFGTQISVDGEPLLVGNNFAQSFALIVHELETPQNTDLCRRSRAPFLWRGLCCRPLRASNLKLRWIERGGPPPPTKVTPGFGSTLLTENVRNSERPMRQENLNRNVRRAAGHITAWQPHVHIRCGVHRLRDSPPVWAPPAPCSLQGPGARRIY